MRRSCFLVSLLLVTACGSKSYTYLSTAAEVEDNINTVMRGAARSGCEVNNHYDSLVGLLIDCEDGRMVVGKPTGANMSAADPKLDPMEVSCHNGLAKDEAECRARFDAFLAQGRSPCAPGEASPGCGALSCGETTCAEVFAQ